MVDYFKRNCLPVGIPADWLPSAATSSQLGRVLPKRESIRCVVKAVLDLDHRRRPDGSASFDDLYSSFFSNANLLPAYLSPDQKIYQAFLDAYASHKKLPYRCLQILADMERRGVLSSAHNWTPTLAALARHPDPTAVFAILDRMESGSLPEAGSVAAFCRKLPSPTPITYIAVIRGFVNRNLPMLAAKARLRMAAYLGPDDMAWQERHSSVLAATDKDIAKLNRGALRPA